MNNLVRKCEIDELVDGFIGLNILDWGQGRGQFCERNHIHNLKDAKLHHGICLLTPLDQTSVMF